MAVEKSIPVAEATAGTVDGIATSAVTRADATTGYRQEMVIADDTVNAARVKVQNAAPGSGDYGLTTRNIPSGTQAVSVAAGAEVDGHSASIGATTDAEATANGGVIALLKRLRTLLSAGLPAALGGSGGLKTELVSAVPAGANLIGKVTLTDGVDTASILAASTTSAATDTPLVIAHHPSSPLPVGGNKIGSVDIATAAATAKGTQGANGVPVQDLKDAGRTYVCITLDAAAGLAAEALATMSINHGSNVTSATSYTVPAGKTLRIIFFGSTVKNTSTVATNSRMRVRAAAAVSATSPILIANECGTAAAVANCSASDDSPFPEGIELAAGVQLGITHIESATTSTVSGCLIAYEY